SSATVVTAAGQGTRMRSAKPTPLHPLLGRRMVDWVIGLGQALAAEPLVVVASPDTADEFADLPVAIQEVPLGTGDAVRSARAAVGDADGGIVLSGDHPLLTVQLLSDLRETQTRASGSGSVHSCVPA